MTDPALLDLAQSFLQEAVYRSRGAQAGKATMAPGGKGAPDGKGQCGLGQEAAVVLDLSPRAEELLYQIWPETLDETGVRHLQSQMAAWVEDQDQLDRKRNHFLKAFRGKHGASRADYDPGTLLAFEQGLDQVNREVQEALLQAARRLIEGRG